MRSRTLRVLGGRDSASLDDGEPERENTVTECPHAARRPAAAAPAGPPPMMATPNKASGSGFSVELDRRLGLAATTRGSRSTVLG